MRATKAVAAFVILSLSLSLTLAACAASETPGVSGGATLEPAPTGTAATSSVTVAPATTATTTETPIPSEASTPTDTPTPTDAPNGSATPAAEPETTGSETPARFGVEDTDIAGLRMGASTYADVLAALGKPDEEREETQAADGAAIRTLTYKGMQAMCTSMDGAAFLLTSLHIDGLTEVEGPRGIRVGMTRDALEARFPREMTQGRTQGNAEYLYAEGIAPDAPEGLDGYYPPFGYIQFETDKDDAGIYTFMAPMDGVMPSFGYVNERQLMLTVAFSQGEVTSFGMFLGAPSE